MYLVLDEKWKQLNVHPEGSVNKWHLRTKTISKLSVNALLLQPPSHYIMA